MILLLACTQAPAPAPVPVPVAAPAPAWEESCRARVEGASTAGECATDGECATAGCSAEVCVARVRVADVMTACEVQPCFAALEACGCHAGLCTWTIRD